MVTVCYDDAARLAAGNWQRFDSFVWHEPVEYPADVCIVYVSNRDSDTLDKANAQAIENELSQFMESGDVVPQRHNHWACGFVDGYAIRVYDDAGEVTAAFIAWCDIQARLQDYPILDESLYSELETEAQNESWELWARADYVRAVESALDVTLDDSDSSAVATAFQAACDRGNVYWESDSIDIDRAAAVTTYDDVRELILPVVLTVYRDGFVLARGTITGDEWRCFPPIYEDEFAACMEAQDSGAEFVNFTAF